jgi:hypothetical protein
MKKTVGVGLAGREITLSQGRVLIALAVLYIIIDTIRRSIGGGGGAGNGGGGGGGGPPGGGAAWRRRPGLLFLAGNNGVVPGILLRVGHVEEEQAEVDVMAVDAQGEHAAAAAEPVALPPRVTVLAAGRGPLTAPQPQPLRHVTLHRRRRKLCFLAHFPGAPIRESCHDTDLVLGPYPNDFAGCFLAHFAGEPFRDPHETDLLTAEGLKMASAEGVLDCDGRVRSIGSVGRVRRGGGRGLAGQAHRGRSRTEGLTMASAEAVRDRDGRVRSIGP